MHPLTRAISGALLAAAAIAAAGCGVSEDQEVEVGRTNAEQINAQLPIITDAELSGYLQSLGKSIASRTSRANLDWRFYLVDSKEVNAFALPGGFIYVNRGLIERTERMDQLAGTLGHEIGHVVRRHSAQQMERTGGANVGIVLLCNLTNVCDSRTAQVAINVGGAAWLAKHSRKAEAEADSEAVANVTRAGIDPQGIPELFRILLSARARQPDRLDAFFASHPLEEQRIVETRRLIDEIDPAIRDGLTRDDAAFQAFRRRLSELPPSPEPPPR